MYTFCAIYLYELQITNAVILVIFVIHCNMITFLGQNNVQIPLFIYGLQRLQIC